MHETLVSRCVLIAGVIYYVVIPLAYVTNFWFGKKEMRPESHTVLVTGGAGYVGSHTVIELLKNNYSVIVVDNVVNCYTSDSNSKPKSILNVEKITSKDIPFYNLDIKDKVALSNIFKLHDIQSVIHFAALKAVGESVQIPLAYYENNIGGSCTLFDVMSKHGVRNIVYSSSATVYGEPQFLPLTENHPTGQKCSNPYGKTKYFTEEILKDLCHSNSEWKVILLRYFNPVGAHESGLIGEDPSGIPNNLMPYISQVAVGHRDKLKIFGNDYPTKDGTGVRDYIHIMDLAVGHVRALEKLEESSFANWKAYNLGTGTGYSVLDMVEAFEKASGKKVKYEFAPRRPGDIAECYSDATLANKELHWSASRSIEQMCQDTWRWQSMHPNGYRDLEA